MGSGMCCQVLAALLAGWILLLGEVGAADIVDSSCLQLRDQGRTEDGVYRLAGLELHVYCDMTQDGGGWTLLLTASSNNWDGLSVFSRQPDTPSLTDDYSILQHADQIRDLGSGQRFAYRIEALADKGRRQLGGVWLAPREFSFVHWTDQQTEVAVVRKFGNWTYDALNGIAHRMPWLPEIGVKSEAVLTTSGLDNEMWHGTLVSSNNSIYHPSPFIYPEHPNSGTVLYWVREEEA